MIKNDLIAKIETVISEVEGKINSITKTSKFITDTSDKRSNDANLKLTEDFLVPKLDEFDLLNSVKIDLLTILKDILNLSDEKVESQFDEVMRRYQDKKD